MEKFPAFRISIKETNSALFGHFMLYNLPYCLFCYSDEVDHLTHQCPQQGLEHSLSLIFGLLPNLVAVDILQAGRGLEFPPWTKRRTWCHGGSNYLVLIFLIWIFQSQKCYQTGHNLLLLNRLPLIVCSHLYCLLYYCQRLCHSADVDGLNVELPGMLEIFQCSILDPFHPGPGTAWKTGNPKMFQLLVERVLDLEESW